MFGRSNFNFKNDQNRLPYSIPSQTATLCTNSKRQKYSCTFFNRYGISNSCFKENACTRERSAIPKLPVKHVSQIETGWNISSYLQPKTVKQIRLRKSFQINQSTESSHIYTTKRLAWQDRLVKCLFPFTSGSESSKIFKVNFQRRIVTNDLPPIRAGNGTQSFCHHYKLDRPNSQRERHSDPYLSRRFSVSPPAERNPTIPVAVCCRSATVSGLADKSPKINIDSANRNTVSGYNLGPPPEPEIPTCRKTLKDTKSIELFCNKKDYVLKRGAEPNRYSKFCEPSSAIRSTSFSPSIIIHQQSTEQRPSQTTCHSKRSLDRANLVDSVSSSQVVTTRTSRKSLSGDRRLWIGMGSPTRRFTTGRDMGTFGKDTPLQPKRNDSYFESPNKPCSPSSRHNSIDTNRQQNSIGLSQEPRRNQIGINDDINLSGIQSTPRLQHTSKYAPPAGQVQCGSRSTFQKLFSLGMASSSDTDGNNFSKMGLARDRPLCVSSSPCCAKVCVSGLDRQRGDIHRRIFPTVGIQSSLGLSTTLFDSQSSCTPEPGEGLVPAHNTSLGESVLASRPEKESGRCSFHYSQPSSSDDRHNDEPPPTESTRTDTRNMEMWGWDQALTSWSSDQVNLLQNSWRVSTKKSYQSAWRRWCFWATKHSINSSFPSGSDLARFLSDLHQINSFAYNTILFHRSVVSTLCHPNNQNLSSHPLVTRILKAISVQKPKASRPPIWDVDDMSSWLSNSFCRNLNLYECSRRTACILLLCSGRRVHDLSLLSIHPDNFSMSDDQIVFWPLYGSKTDSYDYRQSGWKLLPNPDNDALNPIFWIKSLLDLSRQRRSECAINNLFLTVRGTPKAASKTVIANWVKGLLQEAGIKASPGSFRPAVASKNWLLNFPLDDILSRGNWRSQNTFSKFYRREIRPSNQASTVAQFFLPV